MDKKFELTNETIVFRTRTLYRIKALKDFETVKAGDLGGFVEKESNLSQDGNCWIFENAKVYDNARVCNNAMICGYAVAYENADIFSNAIVSGFAEICDNAKVHGHTRIYDNAEVLGDAEVYDDVHIYNNAWVSGKAQVFNSAQIFGNARVYGNTYICDNAKIYGDARVYGKAEVFNSAEVYDEAVVCDNALIRDNAIVFDNAEVYGNAKICGNAIIKEQQTVFVGVCTVDLSKNLKESIRCQTNLIPQKDYVIAFKQVNKDLTSFFDNTFQYKIGEWAEVEEPDMSNTSCATGLHFSNANYWNKVVGTDTAYLIAKIMLDDIITVQRGKIRCKRAFILDKYEIED